MRVKIASQKQESKQGAKTGVKNGDTKQGSKIVDVLYGIARRTRITEGKIDLKVVAQIPH